MRQEEANTEDEIQQMASTEVFLNIAHLQYQSPVVQAAAKIYSAEHVKRFEGQLNESLHYRATIGHENEGARVLRVSGIQDHPRIVTKSPLHDRWQCSCLEDVAWGCPCRHVLAVLRDTHSEMLDPSYFENRFKAVCQVPLKCALINSDQISAFQEASILDPEEDGVLRNSTGANDAHTLRIQPRRVATSGQTPASR